MSNDGQSNKKCSVSSMPSSKAVLLLSLQGLDEILVLFLSWGLFHAGSFGFAGVVWGDLRDKGLKLRVFVFRVFLRYPGGPGRPGVNQAQVFCQGCLRCKSLICIKGFFNSASM